MARILITGGRAPVSLDLVRGLYRQGHEVHVAESQPAQLCRRSRCATKVWQVPPPRMNGEAFIQALEKIIEQVKIDLLIPTCEEVFYVAKGADRLRQKAFVLVDEFEKLNRLHNKWTFIEWARELGFSVPQTVRLTDREQLERAIAHARQDFILKPAYSRFGSRVIYSQGMKVSDLPFPTSSEPWLMQECLHGPEYCSYTIAHSGRVVAHCTYSHEFVAGKAGICFEEIGHSGIEKWVRDFVAATRFTGQIAFDFIETKDGKIYALECNPRSTSGVHLLVKQPEFLQALMGESVFLRPAIGSRGMVALAMWIFGLGQINSFSKLIEWLKILFTSREVIFSWRDPVPFFDQFLCFAELFWQSRKQKVSLLDMSTYDIEWNGV